VNGGGKAAKYLQNIWYPKRYTALLASGGEFSLRPFIHFGFHAAHPSSAVENNFFNR
jgi:hypothetical protein